jgi:3-hydroxyacyl-[acyl-carrier-protein] dehydratase
MPFAQGFRRRPMRWDLIDKFHVLKKGSHSVAEKSFSGEEDFFLEHHPGRPLVPEPLFVEMIAQAGGVLLGLTIDFKKEVILAKIASAAFARAVAPPCRFEVEARLDEAREEGAWVEGRVLQDGRPVAEAKILLVTIDSLGENNKKQIVFTESFLKHFDVYEIARLSEAAL